MNTKEFLKKVAYIKEVDSTLDDGTHDCYFSKFDDSYITRVGMEDSVKYLAKREITDELTHGVGFSPKDNKWYGWSHRAIFGFEVGSTCKKGDCHYVPETPEKLIDDHANFFKEFGEDEIKYKRNECHILPDRSGIRILPMPLEIQMTTVDNIGSILDGEIDLEDCEVVDINKDSFYTIKCGRGEWVAKTMEDAKQMAIDFNEGVS